MTKTKVQLATKPGKVLPLPLPKTKPRPEFFGTNSWKTWPLEGLLDHALEAWVSREHEDVELRADVVLLLRALTRAVRRGDLAELRRKGGPVRWAASYLKGELQPPSACNAPPPCLDAQLDDGSYRAVAAPVLTWFVDQFEASLEERGRDAHRARWLRKNAEAIARFFFARLIWLETAHGLPLLDRLLEVPGALHHDPEAMIKEMGKELRNLSDRGGIHEGHREAAKLIVRALLKGAGLRGGRAFPGDKGPSGDERLKNAMKNVR